MSLLLFFPYKATAADCVVVDTCPEPEMSVREMRKKIEAQEEQIAKMECELLLRDNGQLCFDDFPQCFRTYMRCRESIMKEKKKRYPEMYSNPGRHRYRR